MSADQTLESCEGINSGFFYSFCEEINRKLEKSIEERTFICNSFVHFFHLSFTVTAGWTDSLKSGIQKNMPSVSFRGSRCYYPGLNKLLLFSNPSNSKKNDLKRYFMVFCFIKIYFLLLAGRYDDLMDAYKKAKKNKDQKKFLKAGIIVGKVALAVGSLATTGIGLM